MLYNVGQFPGSQQDISGWEFANTNMMHAYPKSLKENIRTYVLFLVMIREEGHVLLNFLSLHTAAMPLEYLSALNVMVQIGISRKGSYPN